MGETRINVDATFGAEVKVGDMIETGQQLGTESVSGEPVISKVKGLVREIIFDPEEHQLQIIISC